MKLGMSNAIVMKDLEDSGREINAGGPGSGRHRMGETATTKEEHLAAAKNHNERAEVYLQHKGQTAQDLAFNHMKAGQAHENAARLGTARHSQWAQRASGVANGAEDAYPKALAAGGPGSGRHAGGQGRGAPGKAFSKLNNMTPADRLNKRIGTFKQKQAKQRAASVATKATAWAQQHLHDAPSHVHQAFGKYYGQNHADGKTSMGDAWMKYNGMGSVKQGKQFGAANAGGIHTILDKYKIKPKLAKENPGVTAGKKKKKLKADGLPLTSLRDAM